MQSKRRGSISSGSSDSRGSNSPLSKNQPNYQQYQLANKLPISQQGTYLIPELLQMEEAIKLEEHVEEQQVEVVDQENVDIDAKMEEQLQHISLNILPRQKQIKLKEYPSFLPVIIQLQTIKSHQKTQRANIDLVCVVDVSGSMEGKKIQLVKNSLRYVQKILSPGDRITLVTFGTHAAINLPWTRNSLDNKKKIKRAIVNMKIRDSTNIASGVGLGLQMIKERKFRNPVTCMFVLSDGVDDNKGADIRCSDAIQQQNIQDTLSIYTFGYGDDHDAKVMNNIANLKGGQFAYIDQIQRVSEHFILAMGGMLSVKANNVKLLVQSNDDKYRIKKIFGDDYLWKKLDNNSSEIQLNFLLGGDKKEFALELELPISEKQTQIEQENVLHVQLSGTFIELNKPFQKVASLLMQFTQHEPEIQLNEIVEVNYLRGKAGDFIGQAKELANNQKYDQAQQLLNQIIQDVESSPFHSSQPLTVVLKDLKEVKEVCMPKVYKQKGEALLLHKQRNHIQRQRSVGNSLFQFLDNSEEWNECEEEQMEHLKNGDLQLSCSRSGGSDSKEQEDFQEQLPQSPKNILNTLQSQVKRRSSCDSRSRSLSQNSRKSSQS